MSRLRHSPWITALAILLLAVGCAPTQPFYFFEKGDLSHYVGMATKLESPDVKTCSLSEVENVAAPITLTNNHFDSVWDLPLQEAVHTALENSKIIRTLGARFASQGGTRPQVGDAPSIILQTPQSVESVFDPALIETNPNTGVEGALSPYDAVLSSSFTWEHDNQPQNANLAFGSIQPRISLQDIDTLQTSIVKRAAPGTTIGISSEQIYTDSNSPLRELPHDNQQILDFTLQQRLLRGGGTLFNEIHGPLDSTTSGIGGGFNGVMISRINEDLSLADFEASVRNLVDDVENAYWELYFAYRALAAAEVGRDSALETWQKIYALYVVNAKGGEADKEAESRNQYFTFRAQVEQALTDLYRMEKRLRYLMGLKATDGRLIRPSDEPTTARVTFDFTDVHEEALARSVELRKQKWKIKQAELELIASKNLMLPNLDFQGRYRLYGLGEDLIRNDGRSYRGLPTDSIIGTDATATLANADFREWNLGLVFSMPLGLRKEMATIRNQQLLLTRERNILQDQELELSHQVTDVVLVLDSNYHIMQTNFNRRMASEQEVAAVTEAYRAGTITLDLVLQAQQRRSDAEAAYYRTLVDYNRAITQVHFVKGSLLEYDNVFLAEGPWPGKAYFDAHRLARARDAGIYLNYGFSRPSVFSTGPITQHANDDNGGSPATGTPTPAESIGPGRPTEGLPGMEQPSKSQPNDMTPGGSQPPSDVPVKTPTSVRKPRSPSESPSLGSTEGIDGPAAIRTAWTSGAPNRLPNSVESSATVQPSLQWKRAGSADGDSTATSADGTGDPSGWRAKK